MRFALDIDWSDDRHLNGKDEVNNRGRCSCAEPVCWSHHGERVDDDTAA